MWKGKRRKLSVLALLVVLALLPLVLAWVTAPPDPVYKGVRLSTHLYRTYESGVVGIGMVGGRGPIEQECHDALKHLGPKAAPLLTAWIENRPSKTRDAIQTFLRRRQINWPYFTANRQDIVERLFFNVPDAAVPLAEAFQWQILHGDPKDGSRSASLLMFVINSVDQSSREFIAARSTNFVVRLLDEFEKTNEDRYALTLVGPMVQNYPQQVTPEFRERLHNLAKKARYLDSAATALQLIETDKR